MCICARNRLRRSLDTGVQSHWLEIDTGMFTWLFSVSDRFFAWWVDVEHALDCS